MLYVRLAEEGQWLSEHFSEVEFACRCCGKVKVYPELVQKLEMLRGMAGAPVVITSGYRCAGYNKAAGGVENSYHTFGMAADVWVYAVRPHDLAKMAEKAGFDGIGVYPAQGFVHVDVRGYRARWEG